LKIIRTAVRRTEIISPRECAKQEYLVRRIGNGPTKRATPFL
jgi:hypothetical protein